MPILSRDLTLLGLIVAAFAAAMVVHVSAAFGLVPRVGWRRSLLAGLTILPAPIWAWRNGMRWRAGAWVFLVMVWIALSVFASR